MAFRLPFPSILKLEASQGARSWVLPGILLVLLILGVWTRFWDWTERSVWLDEVYTVASAMGNPIYQATMIPGLYEKLMGQPFDPAMPVAPSVYWDRVSQEQPWSMVLENLGLNIQGPFYPALIRGWMAIFGADPVNNRLFSVLCGILTLPAAFCLGRAVKDNRLGYWMLTLAMLSGTLVIFAQTARVYAWMILLCFVSFAWLVGCLRHEGRWQWPAWGAFVVVSLLGLYSHYYYGFVLLAQALYGGWVGKSFPGFIKKWAWTGGAILLGFLPWVWVVVEQLSFWQTYGHGTLSGLWKPFPLIERSWSALFELLGPKSTSLKILAFILVLMGAVAAIWPYIEPRLNRRRELTDVSVPSLPLVCPWAVGSVVVFGFLGALMVLDIVNQTHRLMTNRYFLFVLPGLFLWVAAALDWAFAPGKNDLLVVAQGKQRKWNWFHLVPQLVSIGFLVVLSLNLVEVMTGNQFMKKENYRGAGQFVTSHAQAQDLVLVSHSGAHAAGIGYYLPKTMKMLGIQRPPEGQHWHRATMKTQLKRWTHGYHRVWLVTTHLRTDETKLLKRLLRYQFHIVERRAYNGVRVLCFARKS